MSPSSKAVRAVLATGVCWIFRTLPANPVVLGDVPRVLSPELPFLGSTFNFQS
jgi:hypothetical protein